MGAAVSIRALGRYSQVSEGTLRRWGVSGGWLGQVRGAPLGMLVGCVWLARDGHGADPRGVGVVPALWSRVWVPGRVITPSTVAVTHQGGFFTFTPTVAGEVEALITALRGTALVSGLGAWVGALSALPITMTALPRSHSPREH